MSFTGQQQSQYDLFFSQIVALARQQPAGKLDLRDPTGAIVATVTAHDAPKRPQEMPRHLRPKGRLSKRERDAAKREKLGRS